MGTYEDLKTAIQQVIRTNGNNEITGVLLQQTLLSIVNSVGANAAFAGIATPTTNPGKADQNVYYLATEPGTYANFGGIEVAEGEAVILSNKTGTWTKTISGFATQQQITELESEVIYDVSANNDGATFDSLSALLSSENLSTLIPATVRCGGMSIRFIQGNNYVQYRLNTTSWSESEENWQSSNNFPLFVNDYIDINKGISADSLIIDDKIICLNNNNTQYSCSFVGKNADINYKFIEISKDCIYKIKLSTNSWSTQNTDDVCFAIGYISNGVGAYYHGLLFRQELSELKSDYYFCPPEECTHLYIVYRGDAGEKLTITIETISMSDRNSIRKLQDTGNNDNALYYEFPVDNNRIYKLKTNFQEWTFNNVYSGSVIFSVGYNDGTTNQLYNNIQVTNYPNNIAPDEVNLISPIATTKYFYIVARADVSSEIKVEIEDITEEWNTLSYQHKLFGYNTQWVQTTFPLKNGHVYKVFLSKTNWATTSIPDGEDYSIFGVMNANSQMLKDLRGFTIDIVKGGAIEHCYTFKCDTEGCKIGFRGDVGDSITVTFEDVTDRMEGNVVENKQIVFDVENPTTILSSTDQDATIYDNARIFHPVVIQLNNSLFYMYYGCMGKTDDGSDQSQHFCFAYSTDGINWTRGFPQGITAPYPNEENVILHNVMEASVFRVWDDEYPFRMIVNKFGGEQSVRMVYYKSADGVNWDEANGRVIIPFNVVSDIWGYDGWYSDTQPSCIVRGNYIKIYMRLWKNNVRYIGTMVIDLDGNIVKIPTIEIDVPRLYIPSAFAIDERRELLLPTDYVGGANDDFEYKALLVDGKDFKELSTNINDLITSGIGWGYFASSLLLIDNEQYIVLAEQNEKHNSEAPLTDYVSQLKLIKVTISQ